MVPAEPTTVRDYTTTANGSAQAVIAQNIYRTFLQIGAPQASAVTYSFTNASPTTGGAGCFTLAQATTVTFAGPSVPNGALAIIGTNAAVVPIMEGSSS